LIGLGSLNGLTRLRWVRDTWTGYHRVMRGLDIQAGEWVLDVGSGAGPFPRADVLCDRFPAPTFHRHGQPLTDDRPLVIGDVTRLPFADGAFDVIICSHLLEHVEDPERAVRELQRVARRGYIECPSANWEKLQGFAFHRWLVTLRDEMLVFEEKRGPIVDPDLRSWFSNLQQELEITGRLWLERRRLGVYVARFWDGEIACKVIRKGTDWSSEEHASPGAMPSAQGPLPRPGLDVSGRLLRWHGRRLRSRPGDAWQYVDSALRCPKCGGSIQAAPSARLCMECRLSFPVDSLGRSNMLIENAITQAC
jgi:SAM-dependent methyltransferase